MAERASKRMDARPSERNTMKWLKKVEALNSYFCNKTLNIIIVSQNEL